jgi:hypothetical protein
MRPLPQGALEEIAGRAPREGAVRGISLGPRSGVYPTATPASSKEPRSNDVCGPNGFEPVFTVRHALAV